MAIHKKRIRVKGMSCDGCKRSVLIALREVKGVQHAEVDLQGGSAEVTYDDAQTDLRQIIDAVNRTGIYQASE
ncbi:MAG: heavy-metal-associated domain-containing protein [Bacteroidota bacterium]